MEGLRIRFPGSVISSKLAMPDNDSDGPDLSSFNLSLGSLGDGRLVTSLVKGQPQDRISVVLAFLPGCYQGEPLKITAGKLVMDGEGELIEKVKIK